MRNYYTDLKCIAGDIRRYGSGVALSRYRYDCAKARGNMDPVALNKMHRAILRYLKKNYADLIEKYKVETGNPDGEVTPHRNMIWCFWWQGIETAPEIVKTCLESIRKENPLCNVVIVCKENYLSYIDLPQYIIEGVEQGRISYTSFSDILRFNLLRNYGGIWIDATIFAVNPLPKGYLSEPLFTPKSLPAVSECVADYRWACYLMAGNANHILFRFVVDFYNLYFKQHKSVIHYFMIDYCIELAYENIPAIRAALDAVPVNN